MGSRLTGDFAERLIPFSNKRDPETNEILPPDAPETSYLGLRPGDLIQVTYSGFTRYGLILSSKRTTSGIFLSTRGNDLINFMDIGGLSEAMFSLMINNLYNNESACKYRSRMILSAFLGKQNFRTLNQNKMTDILKVKLDG